MEIFISVDIEADGPIPGDNSMLSLGAAAFTADGKMLSTFSINFETLENAEGNHDTMRWWAENQQAYDQTRLSPVKPGRAIGQFVEWVNQQPGKPVCVCYPAGYDFTWIYWYMIHFGYKSPFSFSALDIKTYCMSMLKTEYRQSTKKNMPKRWFSNAPHTHVALDDAIEQGELFISMLKENTKG